MDAKYVYVSGWNTSTKELIKSVFERTSDMTVSVKADNVESAKQFLDDEYKDEYSVCNCVYKVTVPESHHCCDGNEFSFILTKKLLRYSLIK